MFVFLIDGDGKSPNPQPIFFIKRKPGVDYRWVWALNTGFITFLREKYTTEKKDGKNYFFVKYIALHQGAYRSIKGEHTSPKDPGGPM